MPVLRWALGLTLGLVAIPICQATPLQTTKYIYYPFIGNTASELYEATLSRGPHVKGAKAYASTTATSTQDGKLEQSRNCLIDDYRLRTPARCDHSYFVLAKREQPFFDSHRIPC